MSAFPEPPKISPWLPDGKSRPFWSVMIPAYNARADYLEETLRSVLQQDPGPEEMQIEVVDDASPEGAPVELVNRIGGGRVALHREPANLGLARIWNRCIERARGEWVHILHQDDLVRPGFYAALRKGTMERGCGAAFSRYAVVDSQGVSMVDSELYRESAGLLENWHEEITVLNRIQCPAIVVRRAAYEEVGGFRPQFLYSIDWEMWQRLAVRYSFWFEPAVLAAYRTHPNSATSRLKMEALDALDHQKMIALTMTYHPPARAARLGRIVRRNCARYAVDVARQLLLAGHPRSAWKQIDVALQMSWAWPVLPKVFLFILLRIKAWFQQAAGLRA